MDDLIIFSKSNNMFSFFLKKKLYKLASLPAVSKKERKVMAFQVEGKWQYAVTWYASVNQS